MQSKFSSPNQAFAKPLSFCDIVKWVTLVDELF